MKLCHLLVFFLLTSSNTSFCNDIFKENIEKKIGSDPAVYRILHQRFEIEIKRTSPDYKFLSWLLSQQISAKNKNDLNHYKRDSIEYVKRCSLEKDFSGCLYLIYKSSIFSLEVSDFKYFIKKLKTSISDSEFAALTGIYFQYPLGAKDPVFEYLKNVYSIKYKSLPKKVNYVRVFYEAGFIEKRDFNDIENPTLQSLFRIQSGNTQEVSRICPLVFKSYSEKKLSVFLFCLLEKLKSERKREELLPIIRSAINTDKNNQWLKLTECMLTQKSTLNMEHFIPNSIYNQYYREYCLQKQNSIPKNDINPTGMSNYLDLMSKEIHHLKK